MLWWLIFFMALPIRIKPDKNPMRGNAQGAPSNPMLLKKAIVTTIITAVVTFIFFYLLANGYLDFMSPRE